MAVANGTVEENAGFRMYFNGGKPDEPNYYKTSQGNTDNGDTAIPHTMNGIRIEVTMTSDTAFTANLSAKDGSGTARIADEFDKPCNGFRVWNYNNHEEGENDYKHNIYVDNPKVTATASGAGEPASVSVAIVVPSSGELPEVIEIGGQPELVLEPATGKYTLKVKCFDAGDGTTTIAAGTTLPVYTATMLEGRNWNWTQSGQVEIGEDGAANLDNLPVSTTGVLLVCIGTPPGL